GHVCEIVVTDVMFKRATGCALMCNPFTITARSLYCGKLNSLTPISLNWFFPAGGVDGISFFAGALALLATGSVALTSIQLLAEASRRQPVTLTMSIFWGHDARPSARDTIRIAIFRARMIPPVTKRLTQNPRNTKSQDFSLRVRRVLRATSFVALLSASASAHDPE